MCPASGSRDPLLTPRTRPGSCHGQDDRTHRGLALPPDPSASAAKAASAGGTGPDARGPGPRRRAVQPIGPASVRLVMEPNFLVSAACLGASLASSGHLTS